MREEIVGNHQCRNQMRHDTITTGLNLLTLGECLRRVFTTSGKFLMTATSSGDHEYIPVVSTCSSYSSMNAIPILLALSHRRID